MRESRSTTGSEDSDQKPRSSWAPSPLHLFLHPAGDWRRTWGRHKPSSTPRFKNKKVKKNYQPLTPRPYLWLMADGRHRNMMANRTMENKKRQKASLIHSSFQSCRRTQTFNEGVKVKDEGGGQPQVNESFFLSPTTLKMLLKLLVTWSRCLQWKSRDVFTQQQ